MKHLQLLSTLLQPLSIKRGVVDSRCPEGDLNGTSPQVPVKASPALPISTVPGYVLAGAKSVLVNNAVPGAQVTLLVNGEQRTSVDSIVAEASAPAGSPPLIEVDVPAGSPPLVPGEVVLPVQTLCGEIGIIHPGQGGGVTVVAPVSQRYPSCEGRSADGFARLYGGEARGQRTLLSRAPAKGSERQSLVPVGSTSQFHAATLFRWDWPKERSRRIRRGNGLEDRAPERRASSGPTRKNDSLSECSTGSYSISRVMDTFESQELPRTCPWSLQFI